MLVALAVLALLCASHAVRLAFIGDSWFRHQFNCYRKWLGFQFQDNLDAKRGVVTYHFPFRLITSGPVQFLMQQARNFSSFEQALDVAIGSGSRDVVLHHWSSMCVPNEVELERFLAGLIDRGFTVYFNYCLHVLMLQDDFAIEMLDVYAERVERLVARAGGPGSHRVVLNNCPYILESKPPGAAFVKWHLYASECRLLNSQFRDWGLDGRLADLVDVYQLTAPETRAKNYTLASNMAHYQADFDETLLRRNLAAPCRAGPESSLCQALLQKPSQFLC